MEIYKEELLNIKRAPENFDEMILQGKRSTDNLDRSLILAKSQVVRFAVNAKRDFEAIKSAYLEAMELHAPIDYWKKKAENHERRQKRMTLSLASAAICVIALPVAALWAVSYGWIPTTTLPAGSPDWAVILGPAKGLVAAILTSAVSIWALRIISKIYLSERHLAQDARERVTMITTYLALIKERAASDADRGIILQALFRTTSDGIVKDDGGIDPSALGLLSKLLERRP